VTWRARSLRQPAFVAVLAKRAWSKAINQGTAMKTLELEAIAAVSGGTVYPWPNPYPDPFPFPNPFPWPFPTPWPIPGPWPNPYPDFSQQ
jgi:hypothetical protein